MENPPTPPQFDINYASVPQDSNAPLLVRLAAIFLFVASGLQLIAFLWQLAVSGFMIWAVGHGSPHGSPPPPGFTAIWIGYYGVVSLLAIASSVLCFIAGKKFLSRGHGAFGWGIAAAVVCCLALPWCSVGCILPMGAGIYTIVIICMENVRAYLRGAPRPSAFPVEPGA